MLAELTTSEVSTKDLIQKHNVLAAVLDVPAVKRFENRTIALKRVERLTAELARWDAMRAEADRELALFDAAQARAAVTPTVERKKRQKVFNYPPCEVLKVLQPGSLRARARDLLLGGATLARVEELVAAWDVDMGQEPYRLEPRAYGLVRLLHTWAGYALRQEVVGGNQVIYVMDRDGWAAHKAAAK